MAGKTVTHQKCFSWLQMLFFCWEAWQWSASYFYWQELWQVRHCGTRAGSRGWLLAWTYTTWPWWPRPDHAR